MNREVEHSLTAERISVRRGAAEILTDVDFAVPPGRITSVLGPNGSGKSTLLHALARVLSPSTGQVLLDGRDILACDTREVARRLALLPQGARTPPELTVRDLVAFGRSPHRGWLGGAGPRDGEVIASAIAAVGLDDLANRLVSQLSGGERQRAWIAMALAQETDLFLLDEPTTFLDIAHQLEVLELVQELNRRHGKTFVLVLHDLNLAARYSDHLVLVHAGCIHSSGPPREVMTPETIEEVFGVRGVLHVDPHLGTTSFIPHGRARSARSPHQERT